MKFWHNFEICPSVDCGYNAHKQCKDETAPNCQPTKQLVKRGEPERERGREREGGGGKEGERGGDSDHH